MNTTVPCRMYIVYHHKLFALGLRSAIETEGGVQIVGMENDVRKALKAVRSLRPEVIIVEEWTARDTQWRFLKLATTGRVVTLSLNHACATVYHQQRVQATDLVDLVKVIRGAGKRNQSLAPASQHTNAGKRSRARLRASHDT